MEKIIQNNLTCKMALEIFSLSTIEECSEKLDQQYLKLLRRFPPEFFPQKAAGIIKAYQLLTNHIDYWYEFLYTKPISDDFLNDYLK